MTVDQPLLSNPRSDRVRQVAALGRRAVRARRGQFLAEGPQAVRELVRCVPAAAREVYLTVAALERHGQLADAARSAGARVRTCTPEVLAAMADTEHPQGVLAVADRLDVPVERALAGVGEGWGFVVVLTHVRDPGNAGTVLRGADAFGAAAVLVSESSVDVYNPKVVRATAGSLFHVPVTVGLPVEQLLRACRQTGLRLLAADAGGATPLPEAQLTGPHAWVMGNEAWGLDPQVSQACDATVSIPIVRAESLNLAMAATVCLHASSAARPAR